MTFRLDVVERGVFANPSPLASGTTLLDQFEVSLVDHDLLEEVELTTRLMVASAESPGRLSLVDIDGVLGVTPA